MKNMEQKEQKTSITFQVAECGEFHNLGQYVECETLKEAYQTYQRFLKTSPQMGPSLEFMLHHADNPLYSDLGYPLCMRGIGHEFFTDVPYFEQHSLVQKAVKELHQLEETQAKKVKRREKVR